MWMTRSWWQAKCFTFGFKHEAYAVAKRHLDKAQAESQDELPHGVALSASTRNKVIQVWLEYDLAPKSNVALVNFSIMSAMFVVSLSTVTWLMSGLSRFYVRRPHTTRGTCGRSVIKRDPFYRPFTSRFRQQQHNTIHACTIENFDLLQPSILLE